MTHLWEIEHSYYGPDQCYYARPDQQAPWNADFSSWADFVAEGMFAADLDLNFLYRWDWQKWGEGDLDEDAEPGTEEQLELFWLFARKGMIGKTTVNVTEADEPAVREWLQVRANYVRDMWAPFDLSATTEEG